MLLPFDVINFLLLLRSKEYFPPLKAGAGHVAWFTEHDILKCSGESLGTEWLPFPAVTYSLSELGVHS